MGKKSNAIGFENFTKFACDLDALCRGTDNFMGLRLLRLVRGAFGYETVTLSRYDQTRFCWAKSIGLLDVDEAVAQYQDFQKRDPFVAHIIRICEQVPTTQTLQSSRVFGNQYFNSDYYRFLYRFGLSWALSIPIGEFGLTVYKPSSEADFTEDEHSALRLLSVMLNERYAAKKAMGAQKAIGHIHSKVLDSIGVGVICSDENMEIQSCNQAAASFFQQAYQGDDFQSSYYQLCSLMRQNGTNLPGVHEGFRMESMDHTLIMERAERRAQQDNFYTLTIFPQSGAKQALSREMAPNQYGLSGRELEVSRLLISGMTYQQVAGTLFISLNTVRTHIKNAYKKTGVNNLRRLAQLLDS